MCSDDVFIECWEYMSHSKCVIPVDSFNYLIIVVPLVVIVVIIIITIIIIKYKKYIRKRQFLENIPVIYPAIKFKLKDKDKNEIILFKEKYIKRGDAYFLVPISNSLMSNINIIVTKIMENKNIIDLQVTTQESEEDEKDINDIDIYEN
jgi:hypothetical protein